MAEPSDKQMLRDANGDLIPQYWDVVEGDFKALTGQDGAQDTRLTGSIAEEFFKVTQTGTNDNYWFFGKNLTSGRGSHKPIDVSMYKKLAIKLENNYDSDIDKIRLFTFFDLDAVYYDFTAADEYADREVMKDSLGEGQTIILDSSNTDILNNLLVGLSINTSGIKNKDSDTDGLTVSVLGWRY